MSLARVELCREERTHKTIAVRIDIRDTPMLVLGISHDWSGCCGRARASLYANTALIPTTQNKGTQSTGAGCMRIWRTV